MNGRIKQLAEQAGLYHRINDNSLYPTYLSAEQSGPAYQKFAELIVKEHINLLIQEWYDLNNVPETENETPHNVGLALGRKTEVSVLMTKISKHFGVEE